MILSPYLAPAFIPEVRRALLSDKKIFQDMVKLSPRKDLKMKRAYWKPQPDTVYTTKSGKTKRRTGIKAANRKEYFKIYQSRYYWERKERVHDSVMAWRGKHPEKCKEYAKRAYEKSKRLKKLNQEKFIAHEIAKEK